MHELKGWTVVFNMDFFHVAFVGVDASLVVRYV